MTKTAGDQTAAPAYVVLARKWRPGQFSDLVGQEHVVRTLTNAIRAERIHQAYLFTGSRGIGKTSIARIFAKIIRCENTKLVGESLRSCDECASCREITSGTSVDVIEIDGASNNGVESVREIRENAKYLPSSGGRKIYIIDEVHMLTTAAFNALLKTLEEPPAHVIFIFATTEPHKIPSTILSRCQRFDFRRVSIAQIQTRLAEVTHAEGIEAEPAALALIARAAEGGMRDALSLLDQVIAFSGKQVTTQSVRDSVGLIESQTLLGILSGIFERRPVDALALVEQAYQQGHDLKVLTRSLIEFCHAAVLAKVGVPPSSALEFSAEEWERIRSASAARELEEIELIFQVLHYGLDWIARSPQPKVVLDVLVVKCATAEALVRLDGSTSSNPASASGSLAAKAAPTNTVSAPEKTKTAVEAPLSHTAASAPIPAPSPTAAGSSNHRSWEGFTELVRGKRPLLASILENGFCTDSDLNAPTVTTLNLCFRPQDAYFKEQLQSRIYQEQLSGFTKEYFGRVLPVRVELRDAGETIAAKRERVSQERAQAARQAAHNHPVIMEARALFGGELGPIELTAAGGGAAGNA